MTEVLVVSVAGLVVLGAVLIVFMTTSSGHSTTDSNTYALHRANVALDRFSRDVRGAYGVTGSTTADQVTLVTAAPGTYEAAGNGQQVAGRIEVVYACADRGSGVTAERRCTRAERPYGSTAAPATIEVVAGLVAGQRVFTLLDNATLGRDAADGRPPGVRVLLRNTTQAGRAPFNLTTDIVSRACTDPTGTVVAGTTSSVTNPCGL